MTVKRATSRPGDFVKPAHWDNAPAPAPDPLLPNTGGQNGGGAGDGRAEYNEPEQTGPEQLSPTRYGDWVKNGIAIDF